MLTLYVKTGCPYCTKVLEKVKELHINIEEKNILDRGVIDELVELGGKRQTPFLFDAENDVQIYGSDDINQYLDAHYADGENKEVVLSGNSEQCTSEC